jgi:hypothetical protein
MASDADELYWRSIEDELAAVEQEEADAVSAQIQNLRELMEINRAEEAAYCSDAAVRERAAASAEAAAAEELYWCSIEEELTAVEQEEADAVSARVQNLQELVEIDRAEAAAYCSDAAVRERAAASAEPGRPEPPHPAPPRRERQRLKSRGIRNHYTSYKTDSGEYCSPHEVSYSEASESDEYNGISLRDDPEFVFCSPPCTAWSRSRSARGSEDRDHDIEEAEHQQAEEELYWRWLEEMCGAAGADGIPVQVEGPAADGGAGKGRGRGQGQRGLAPPAAPQP